MLEEIQKAVAEVESTVDSALLAFSPEIRPLVMEAYLSKKTAVVDSGLPYYFPVINLGLEGIAKDIMHEMGRYQSEVGIAPIMRALIKVREKGSSFATEDELGKA
jgi:hypothetical protein